MMDFLIFVGWIVLGIVLSMLFSFCFLTLERRKLIKAIKDNRTEFEFKHQAKIIDFRNNCIACFVCYLIICIICMTLS